MESKKPYDLEERTFKFAKECKEFCKKISRSIHNLEYYKQLIRSSGSVAANYIEANENFSKKDYRHRVKICRKEAKESRLWLMLIDVDANCDDRNKLSIEAEELMKIFGAILRNTAEESSSGL